MKPSKPLFFYIVFLTVINLIMTVSCVVLYSQVLDMTFKLQPQYAYTTELRDFSAYWDFGEIQVNWFFSSSESQIRIYLIRNDNDPIRKHEGKIRYIELYKGSQLVQVIVENQFFQDNGSFWFERTFTRPLEGLDYIFKIELQDS